jgi:NhaP-type Na+/H+ or K+/H+ antiporter
MLGPGTLLSAALISVAGWGLLGLAPAMAVIVGAALASTDPVLLRGLMRRRDLSSTARQALRLESGLNDVVLLPVVLIAMTFVGAAGGEAHTDWVRMAINLFLLGPGAGVAIGLLGVAALDLIRRRIGVRRDYEALYSLGIAFAAFAAAEEMHGSGFLATFAAGLTIAALDVELCDCFLEYGETTAEVALLFTFVLFGSSLIWTGLDILSISLVLFAVLVLLIRPAVFLPSLIRVKLSKHARFLISWFGPRGLSTLLLVLLPVFDGVPGSDRLFAICAFVVLVSILVHGGSLMMLGRSSKSNRPPSSRPQAEEGPAQQLLRPVLVEPPTPRQPEAERAEAEPGDTTDGESEDRERISIAEMRRLQQAEEPLIVVDARSERTYDDSDSRAVGSFRIDPTHHAAPQAQEMGLPRDAWLVIYCA